MTWVLEYCTFNAQCRSSGVCVGERAGDRWLYLCGGEGRGPLAVSYEHKIRNFFVPF